MILVFGGESARMANRPSNAVIVISTIYTLVKRIAEDDSTIEALLYSECV